MFAGILMQVQGIYNLWNRPTTASEVDFWFLIDVLANVFLHFWSSLSSSNNTFSTKKGTLSKRVGLPWKLNSLYQWKDNQD